MQIIIEIKNPKILNRVLDLLKITEWLGDIRIWKKEDAEAKEELIYNFPALATTPNLETPIDYREFWNCIEPKMGVEAIDRQIAEMRED